jgi:hypothetical protein
MVKWTLGFWPSSRASYGWRDTTGLPIVNFLWHQSWIRRGQPRRIACSERPFNTREHMPLYVLARTVLPQLIWGTASKGASVILQAWGIKYLTTASPCEL